MSEGTDVLKEIGVVLATAGYDHTIRFWDVLEGHCLATLQHNESQVNCMKLSADKKLLAVAGNPNVRIFDVIETMTMMRKSLENSQSSLGNSQEIPAVVSNSTANIAAQTVLQGHKGNVISVGFQQDARWLYTASTDGTIKIWDPRTQKHQLDLQNKHSINRAVLHGNQAEIISCDEAGAVKVWDLTKGTHSHDLIPEDQVPMTSVAISEDGDKLAAVNEKGNLYYWQSESSETALSGFTPSAKIISAHSSHITKCLFSPDSEMLVTCGADHIVKKWNCMDGRSLTEAGSLIGHTQWIWDCEFSADSNFLLTASSDQTARLWDVHSEQVMCVYSGHSKALTSVAMNDAV